MAKYSEETLRGWSKPARPSEEKMISNAISMIKDAINSHYILKDKNIEPIVQGSYANNTNVRLNSDIDIALMLKDTFYHLYPEGATDADYGFGSETGDNFSDYRKYVIDALTAKFGAAEINVGNKSIKIQSNSYHVQADAVPAFQYRNYKRIGSKKRDKYIEGIKFYSGDHKEVINYPKIHVENGIDKNSKTSRRFKRTVRIYKKIRIKMIEDGINVPNGITSFLLECLLWNVPNSIYLADPAWNDLLPEVIKFLHNSSEDEKNKWAEVSGIFYLFHSGRKWTISNANDFLKQMWNYLGYDK